MGTTEIIAALAARVDALTAEVAATRCECGSCNQRASMARSRATQARHRELYDLPREERAAIMRSMPAGELSAFMTSVASLSPMDCVDLVTLADERDYDRLRGAAPSHLLELIDLDPRRFEIPKTCWLRCVEGGVWPRSSRVEISEPQARALRATGLELYASKGPHSWLYKKVSFPERGDRHQILADGIPALLAVDPELAANITKGTVLVIPATEQEDLARVREARGVGRRVDLKRRGA